MPSPPVLRLSYALYNDAPMFECSKCPRLSICKRALEQSSMTKPRALRLLLPRTFSRAVQAYHERRNISDSKRKRRFNHICPCQDEAFKLSSISERHSSLHNGGDHGVAPPCEPYVRECGLASVTCVEGQLTSVVRTVVVVESLLGFLAVRSLLEQSYRSDSDGGGVLGLDEAEVKLTMTDTGPSKALRRLVGWLCVAEANTRRRYVKEIETSGCEDVYGILSADCRNAMTASTLVGGNAGPAGVCRERNVKARFGHGSRSFSDEVYTVAAWCEAGSEWSGFFLEPAERLTAGAGDKGGGAHVSNDILDVEFICHPLVTMEPDLRWCIRLIRQAKAMATLLNANAKLSTLGGGYFLTRQVKQAIHLARAQSQVATALGDVRLAGKCRINEAYNYIWLGRYAQARSIIHAQIAVARTGNDVELENVATVADRFLERARRANRALLQIDGGVRNADARGGADAGQRRNLPRIDVKTDEWHRVRALPMYCTT